MSYRTAKLGCISKNGTPFICRILPFIGLDNPSIFPFIGRKLPFVGNRGFTLTELVITLTVAAILMAVAAPSMNKFVASNRLASQINELIADINLARSEAIKRSVTTGICAADSAGTSCVGSGNWADGWLVYYVCPSTDTTCTAGNNVVLKTHEALSGKNTLAHSTTADSLVYTRNGVVSSGTGEFELCDPRRGKARKLNVLVTGRPALSEDTC